MKVNAIDDCAASLEDLRAVLDASGVVGTWDWDVVRRTVRYDRGAARLLAGDANLAGRTLGMDEGMAGIHPDDRPWLHAEVGRALRLGGLVIAEYRAGLRSNDIRWVLSRGRVHLDAIGQPMRSQGILIDITESREPSAGCVARAGGAGEGTLEEATTRCLEARAAIGPGGSSKLRLMLDLTLLEIGRELARRSTQ